MSDIDTDRMMQGIDSPPQQRCGTCRWWSEKNSIETSFTTPRQKKSYCRNTQAIGVHENRMMLETEGQDCPVYEERKL